MFSKVLSCDDSNARKGIGTIRKKLLKMHLIRQISNHLTVGKQQAEVMTEPKRINWNRVSIYKPEGECRETGSHTLTCAAQYGSQPPHSTCGCWWGVPAVHSIHCQCFTATHGSRYHVGECRHKPFPPHTSSVSYYSRRHFLNPTSVWWVLPIRLSWFMCFDTMFLDTLKYKITAFIEHLLCVRHYTKHLPVNVNGII